VIRFIFPECIIAHRRFNGKKRKKRKKEKKKKKKKRKKAHIAMKVIPPIYFHGNNETILDTKSKET